MTAFCAVSLAVPASAAGLPEVKVSSSNTVPECATPGRLTAFLENRNARLDDRFSTIAADYMRVGQELGIRWDTAFFQMLLETGNLTFTGDVSSKQNNFAGLGATGRKAPGESFPDVATGVKAHLQHLLMYAGETVQDPVAERTRKVQEWGVLTNWQKSIKGPMTYGDIAKQWAPTSRGYSRDIASVADDFYNGACKSDDPKPEMMALVTKDAAKATAAAAPVKADGEVAVADNSANPKVSGAELARRAVDEARSSGSFVRSNLGGQSLAKAIAAAPAAATDGDTAAKVAPSYKVLNAPEPPTDSAATAPDAAATATATVQTAALGSNAKIGVKPAPHADAKAAAPTAAPAAGSKCKVWTASYGGSRAIIIKASADETTNYTVLDVNEGAEKREADAYISAYAHGGQPIGEFTNQTQALDKAFELCPEG
ncbi:MAG: glucosaminidase domain-containing protein [Hyphomicrobium sp.]